MQEPEGGRTQDLKISTYTSTHLFAADACALSVKTKLPVHVISTTSCPWYTLAVAAADQLWFAARSPSLDFSLFLQLLGPADGPHGGQIIQSKRSSVTKSVEHVERLILRRFFPPLDESGMENV